MDANEARELVRAEETQRVQECQEMVQKVLDRFQCQLLAQAFITQDGRVAARVVLVPKQGE